MKNIEEEIKLAETKAEVLWQQLMALEDSEAYKTIMDQHKRIQTDWCHEYRKIEALKSLL